MEFNKLLKEIDLELSPRQLEQFEIYFNFLVEYNNFVNLTAITEEEDVYIKHFHEFRSLLLKESDLDVSLVLDKRYL